MKTLFHLLRTVTSLTFGIALAIGLLVVAVLLVITGSYAVIAWTGWPGFVAVLIMLALMVVTPWAGAIIGIIGIFYLPW